MTENVFKALKNRILQLLARISPGAYDLRVVLHRMRGVHIGKNVWLGYDSIIETGYPELVWIGNNVSMGIRVILIAHYPDWEKGESPRVNEPNLKSIVIEDDVYIGPGVIILPSVKIGKGSVITAGSVVTHSIPANVYARGNPAEPVARCGIPYSENVSLKLFVRNLKPL